MFVSMSMLSWTVLFTSPTGGTSTGEPLGGPWTVGLVVWPDCLECLSALSNGDLWLLSSVSLWEVHA